MQSIVIRHLSGTKGNQVEEVSLDGFRDILIGREAHARIQYDADREDLVSRNHACIVRDPADPNGFLLTDLDSRNGTAINNQRIFGASRLRHGDRVQLGLSGPEFSFELSPPPAARPTRLAELPRVAPPSTREASVEVPPGESAVQPASPGDDPARAAAVRAYLRKSGMSWLVVAVAQFVFSAYLSAVWGAVCLVLGVLNLAWPRRGMLIANGIALILVGLGNFAGSMSSGEPGIFTYLGVMQVIWGIKELRIYTTGEVKR